MDQFTTTIGSVQEAISSLRIDEHHVRRTQTKEVIRFDQTPPSLYVPIPILTSEGLHVRLDRLEHQLGQMRVSDRIIDWDDSERPPIARASFQMPAIVRFTDIGCPRAHLKLYSLVMTALGRYDTQLVALFPLSLSGLAQQWFALLDPSRWRTWNDLAHEFLRQYSFSTTIDVSRRELYALRYGSYETIASFLTLWREKMAHIIVDRPLEREHIQMVVRRFRPRIVRHLIGIPFTDFASLTSAFFWCGGGY